MPRYTKASMKRYQKKQKKQVPKVIIKQDDQLVELHQSSKKNQTTYVLHEETERGQKIDTFLKNVLPIFMSTFVYAMALIYILLTETDLKSIGVFILSISLFYLLLVLTLIVSMDKIEKEDL